MANRTTALNDRLYDYLIEVSVREPPLLRELREETAALPMAMMQIGPEQGQFMRLLIELIGARRAVEVGTFTGYSALCVAEAMGPQGRLVACDVSEEYTGVADRIDLRLGPAVATLDQLLAKGAAGTIDFVFIDANKTDYDAYYERALKLLRPAGLIAVDNVLWGGAVADPAVDDEDTSAIRALNRKLATDERVNLSLVPIGDGLTLARKRA